LALYTRRCLEKRKTAAVLEGWRRAVLVGPCGVRIEFARFTMSAKARLVFKRRRSQRYIFRETAVTMDGSCPTLQIFIASPLSGAGRQVHSQALDDTPGASSLHDETVRQLRLGRNMQAPSRLLRSIQQWPDGGSGRMPKRVRTSPPKSVEFAESR